MKSLDPGRGAAAIATVRVRQDQVDGLRTIVETEGCTEADLIRQAVDLLLAERDHPTVWGGIYHFPRWPRECAPFMGGKAPIEPGTASVHKAIRFGPEQAQRLARAAQDRGCNQAQLIREAVDELLDRLADEGAKAS
jgi:Arc/MetJ-type ribon-helix-helix transcriptional regulator